MGLGYIGLPTAIIAAKHGIQIMGVDINPQVVEMTNAGHLHIIEPGMEEMLQEVVNAVESIHKAGGERCLFHGSSHSIQRKS